MKETTMSHRAPIAATIAALLGACGGGNQNASQDAHRDDGATSPPLTCKSAALCTTYEVKTFVTTQPAPSGGSIRDGLYRLAYDLVPANADVQAGYYDELDALEIRGGSYVWTGLFRDHMGTVATSGTSATFMHSQNCHLGAPGDPASRTDTYQYTATASELDLYATVTEGTKSWLKMYVYVPDPGAGVCGTVSAEPTTPGDSAMCTVTNCACSFAVEGTVNQCH
jgi:hypothetical protein